MKLIAYLLIVALVACSSGLSKPAVSKSTMPNAQIVLTQPQRGHSPALPDWQPHVWVEQIFLSRRRRHPRRVGLFARLRRWFRDWRQQWSARVRSKARASAPVSANGVEAASPVRRSDTGRQATIQPVAVPVTTAVSAPSQRKRGRPRVIPTAHLCCPHAECAAYRCYGDDPRHDIIGFGTYTTTHGAVRQLYRCQVCGRTFSETAGTPFFGLKHPMRTVVIALQELAEGLGIRAVARIHGTKPDTVLDWLRKAGQHCEAVSQYMLRDLSLSQVQMDELWTFVHKKERMLTEWDRLHTDWGDTWIWVAFDPVHKLVVAVLVGERTEEAALSFLSRLRSRLAAACQPLLTSDSLPHYAGAILKTCGRWVQPQRHGERGRFPKPRPVPDSGLKYATVHKERVNGRIVSVTTRIVYGRRQEIEARLTQAGQRINTAFVERINLTLRHLVSRLHRKTLCFSKKREYLEYHLHLALAYYHFSRYHASLRRALPQPIPTRGNGTPKQWQQRTPAMAAGLTDHQWSLRELLTYHAPPP